MIELTPAGAPDRASFILPIQYLVILPTPYFRFADPYPTSAFLSLLGPPNVQLQFLAVVIRTHCTAAEVLSAPCAAAMRHGRHRLSVASLRLHVQVSNRRCPARRRSPRPPQRDQPQAGRVHKRSGCGGSLFFLMATCVRHVPGAQPIEVRTLLRTGARYRVHDRGVPAARLNRNRFGLGVSMGAV